MPIPGIKRPAAKPGPVKVVKSSSPVVSADLPPPVDLDQWSEQTIPVQNEDGSKDKVAGKVYGQMVVLEGSADDLAGKYLVIHLNTWHRITWADTEEDAMRIGTYLWENACLLWRYDDPGELTEATPTWIKEWAKACRTECKWLPPSWYQEQYPN